MKFFILLSLVLAATASIPRADAASMDEQWSTYYTCSVGIEFNPQTLIIQANQNGQIRGRATQQSSNSILDSGWVNVTSTAGLFENREKRFSFLIAHGNPITGYNGYQVVSGSFTDQRTGLGTSTGRISCH
jgi:hypothetical protein